MTIARFNRMLKNVKENSEILTKAKKISTDGRLPQNILLKASEEIKSDVSLFLAVRKMDSEHEKMPSAKKVTEAVHRRQSLKDIPSPGLKKKQREEKEDYMPARPLEDVREEPRP